jgi:aspartyl-tRNA(Asn)/glutamyl-tRNA(Gln) amidotransferase subunit C
MKISKTEVLHVADLARLDLDEDSVARFAEQIGEILAYVETLDRADTEGVSPTSHAISLTNAFREDVERPSSSQDEAFSNAPHAEDGCFVVPKIIE